MNPLTREEAERLQNELREMRSSLNIFTGTADGHGVIILSAHDILARCINRIIDILEKMLAQ